MRSIASPSPLTVFDVEVVCEIMTVHRQDRHSILLHALMDTRRYRFGDPQRAVDTPALSGMAEHQDARFVNKQAPDKVVAHGPELGQLVHGEMSFKRRL
jgi:hypothetical protein